MAGQYKGLARTMLKALRAKAILILHRKPLVQPDLYFVVTFTQCLPRCIELCSEGWLWLGPGNVLEHRLAARRRGQPPPLALSVVHRLEPVPDVFGDFADLSPQVGLRNTPLPSGLDKISAEFRHILRRAGSPVLLDGLNAVLGSEVDKLASRAHVFPQRPLEPALTPVGKKNRESPPQRTLERA